MEAFWRGLERLADRWFLHRIAAAGRDLFTANGRLCWKFLLEGLLAARHDGDGTFFCQFVLVGRRVDKNENG